MDERTALDRVKFLRWPKTIKSRLYNNPQEEGYWYICEIEEKIILPALVNYPEYFEKVDVNDVRGFLFKKLDHSLTRSTDVRKVAPYFRAEFNSASDRKKIKAVLAQLVERPEMSYDEAQSELQKHFPDFLQRDPPSPRKVVSLLITLQTELERFDAESIEGAKRRGKASRHELLAAARSLSEALAEFIKLIE